MRVLRSTASAMSIGKQKNTFASAGVIAATKEADVVVKDIGNGINLEKKGKKKGIMRLFGRKN
jgi:predicted site-specific integrase-resolvase